MCLLLTGALCFQATALSASDADEDSGSRTWYVRDDNDSFTDFDSDRHYSNGFSLGYATRRCPSLVREAMPDHFVSKAALQCSASLNQLIFSPARLNTGRAIRNDRPYAGWLFVEISAASTRLPNDSWSTLHDRIALRMGATGSASLAEEVQTEWHEQFDGVRPRGWRHQVDNTLAVQGILERQVNLRVLGERTAKGISVDLTPRAGLSIGNAEMSAAVGITATLGFSSPARFQSLPIWPGYFSGVDVRADPGFAASLFTAWTTRFVGYSLFIEGPTKTNIVDVSRKPVVHDLSVGVNLTIPLFGSGNAIDVSILHTRRSREFRGQRETDEFGGVILRYVY